MCNSRNRSIVRSARNGVNQSDLLKPAIPVADAVDGLIKTADLESDITVNITVWPGSQQGDGYQLNINGIGVGEIGLLDPLPPVGTIVSLDLPVAPLTMDGPYLISYSVGTFPGGTNTPSPATTIVIDRTPPGTHQLGYMEFPEEAKDGLTSAELSAMGDVLTGKIFGYVGLSRGDTIKSYWGVVAGPEVVLSGNEDESEPLEVPFDRAFLSTLESSAGATFYTVTDRAGNVSAPSKNITIPLFLTEVTPGLPAPVVDDLDQLINHEEAAAGVDVKIPLSTLIEEGDEITLHWGAEKIGPYPVQPEDIAEPFILIFNIDHDTIESAGNGTRQISYDVIRSGQIVGLSEVINIQINTELPVQGILEKGTVIGASNTPSNEDNVIDYNDFELNATVIINWNPGFKPLQKITLYWGGQEVLEQPYTLTNSDIAAGRPLLLTALNTKFKPVGTGNDIRVYYTVTSDGNPNTSTAPEQGIIVQSKSELPGGPDGPDAPEFTALNSNGAINPELSKDGAPVYVKPYLNIAEKQVIAFTYEAYDALVGGNLKFTWHHTSPELTEEEVQNGYTFFVPRSQLINHCYGHAEAIFQVRSSQGQGNSRRASVYVDMRSAGSCSQ